jgi:transglutaminase-like putative cysteine protease
MTANYSYVVTATGTSFQISIHTVQSFSYCNVTKTMVYVRPDRPFTQSTTIDELGNDVLTIKVQSLNVLGRFTITVLQHLTVYSVAYQIDPNGVGSYDTASELYRTYTKATQYIESDHPEMIAKSKEIVGDETNPFLAAKKIHNFVVRHITYDASAVTPWKPETEGALFALRSGRGMCRHFAALSTALARAAGIPTADIWGSAASPIDKGDQKHNWVHYYVPNYGWVPAEPTLEKGSRLDCFARLPNNRDIPVMSVSYTYRRAWWSGGTVDKPFSGEEPIILEGFQVSEFSGSTAALLTFAMVAVCLIMRREPRRQTSAKKS